MVIRPLMITQEGTNFLLSEASQAAKHTIRFPIELMHLPSATVLGMFCPTKRVDDPVSKKCTVDGCDKTRHTKLVCFTHYQIQRRSALKLAGSTGSQRSLVAATRPNSEGGTRTHNDDGFISSHDSLSQSSDRAASCPQTPSVQHRPHSMTSDLTTSSPGASLLRPVAVHGSVNISQSSNHDTESDSSTACSSDTNGQDDEHELLHSAVPMEGQFYPGTTHNPTSPPVHGSTANRFIFDRSDPYAAFNSYAKQQLRGSISAFSQIRRFKCLGVFICSDSKCGFLMRPRIAAMRHKREPLIFCNNVGLHQQKSVRMIHVKCPVIFHYTLNLATNYTNLEVQDAPHMHALPPPNKLAPTTLVELSKMVKEGTQLSTMRFASNSQDPAAMAPRRLTHEHKKLFHDTFGSDLGIGGLSSLNKLTGGKPWVRFAQPTGTSEGDFQLVFCQLPEQQKLCSSVACAYKETDSETTPYVYTDVTYAYSESYAQSFVTDSLRTGRGVVIAFCLMTRLTFEAYEASFFQFLKLNPDLWIVQGGTIILRFYLIVDFADSQRKGFIAAIQRLHEIHCRSTPWTRDMEQNCMKHLKGCEFHYKQSVKNTAHNGNVVPHFKAREFTAGCEAMLTATTVTAFEAATNSVLIAAPKAKTWLKWWLNPMHACLIFPSFRTHELNQDLREFLQLPTTSNMCESNHRNYYRYLQVKHLPIVVAAYQCFMYCQHQIRDITAVATGLKPLRGREKSALFMKSAARTRSDEWDAGRPPVATSEHFKLPDKRAPTPSVQMLADAAPSTPPHIKLRQEIIRGNGLSKRCIIEILTRFPDGLAKGQVVEVQNDSNEDRWYAQIVQGKAKGDLTDPYVVGLWLKANSTTEVENSKSERIHIKSIIAIVDD